MLSSVWCSSFENIHKGVVTNHCLHQVPFGRPLDKKLEGASEDESLIFCKPEEETFCIVLEPCVVAKPVPHA